MKYEESVYNVRLQNIRVTSRSRSLLMSRVRHEGTNIELVVAQILDAQKERYRMNVKGLPGSPDFANDSHGWAIFVNGCFWHGHDCPHGRSPKTNLTYWKSKIDTNRVRDRRNTAKLRRQGYSVLTVWGCQTADTNQLAWRVNRFLTRPRAREARP